MTKATDPAYPVISTTKKFSGDGAYGDVKSSGGMNIRTRIAMAAMQGMLASHKPDYSGTPVTVADYAVDYADALIARLNREESK